MSTRATISTVVFSGLLLASCADGGAQARNAAGESAGHAGKLDSGVSSLERAAAQEPPWSKDTAAKCNEDHKAQMRRRLVRQCAIEEATPNWRDAVMFYLTPVLDVPVARVDTSLPHIALTDWSTSAPSIGSPYNSLFSSTPDNPKGPFWPTKVAEVASSLGPGPVQLVVTASRPMGEVAEMLEVLSDGGVRKVQFVVQSSSLPPLPSPTPELASAISTLQGGQEASHPSLIREPGEPLSLLPSLVEASAECAPLTTAFRKSATKPAVGRCQALASSVPEAILDCACAADGAVVTTLLQHYITGRPAGFVEVTLGETGSVEVPADQSFGEWAPKHLRAGAMRLVVKEPSGP